MHLQATVAADEHARPEPAPAPPQAVEFRYTQTDGFVALLHEPGASLLVSTYQANKLLAVRGRSGRVVDPGPHLRPAHGPGGGRPAVGRTPNSQRLYQPDYPQQRMSFRSRSR